MASRLLLTFNLFVLCVLFWIEFLITAVFYTVLLSHMFKNHQFSKRHCMKTSMLAYENTKYQT